MKFDDLSMIFNRASRNVFSRNQVICVFPILALCGLLCVFFRAISINESAWIQLTCWFFPVFLSAGLLLVAGVLCAKIYHHKIRSMSLSLKTLLMESSDCLLGVSYFTLPTLLLYLCLWIVMGVFYLLQQVPAFGEFLSVIFAFAPFLLVLGSVFLSFFNVWMLFFASPHVALQSRMRFSIIQEVVASFNKDVFLSTCLFLIALVPVLFSAGVLVLTIVFTHAHFLLESHEIARVLQWFFLMVPFCMFLTPVFIFFFNFSVESYQLIQSRESLKF